MFKRLNGEVAFDQWELNQLLTNDSMVAGDRVRFVSANGETGITYAREADGKIVADVPNELLRVAMPITVQLGDGASWKCEHKTTFAVNPAKMPGGYECTDNTWRPDPNAHTCTGGGVTSWDELEGKPFGEEECELYNEVFQGDHTFNGTGTVINKPDADKLDKALECGVVTVYFDGEKHENVPVTVGSYGDIQIGNRYVTSGNESHNTGEPFVFYIEEPNCTVHFLDVEPHSVRVVFTTTHTLDPKFLPDSVKGGGALPVINKNSIDVDTAIEYAKQMKVFNLYTNEVTWNELIQRTARMYSIMRIDGYGVSYSDEDPCCGYSEACALGMFSGGEVIAVFNITKTQHDEIRDALAALAGA